MDCAAVQAVDGRSSGLGAAGVQFWHQNTTSVPDRNEPYDLFGLSL